MDRPLWTCPACGRQFANRNQPHSCGDHAVARFLDGRPADAVALFEAFAAAIGECGPFLFAPAATRVGFQVRMIFAAVNRLGEAGLDAHVVLARRLESPRFRKVESLGPRSHVHHFRLRSPDDIDDEVREWLAESYAVGEQRHLRWGGSRG